MANFLLEIGVEEIPDWMIEPALADLRTRFAAVFAAFGGSAITTNATPRRLVLQAKDLIAQAPDVEAMLQGPYLSAGEKAAEGFAKKQNTTIDKLAKMTDAKGERYVFHQLVKGQAAAHALREQLPEIVTGLHFPKTMYWTAKGGVKFIRPIRWIVALLDDQIIPFEIAGVKSGNNTRGHRVLGAKTPLLVGIANYKEVLRANFVIVSAEERKARIEKALGSDVQKDEELLKTLVYLTEFPTPIRGSFDKSFLELPKEILSTVMRHHQRYFSVLNTDGSLASEFVAVTNTEGDPDGLIRQGNERVLRARFNDALFFWQVDLQKKLSERVNDLARVTFQAKLGSGKDSYKNKTERVAWLAKDLARKAGADEDLVNLVDRASWLCKCDLTTEMVKEFPELQGVVGGLYASAQNEDDEIATAISEHYKPTSMVDTIPSTFLGQILSVADKLDTLRECFGVNLVPTGSRDPFALRRSAQGVVKILFDAELSIKILELGKTSNELNTFMRERIAHYLHDIKGFAYDEVNAVLGMTATTPSDIMERLSEFRSFRATDNFEPLTSSFKRIKNIIRQSDWRQVASNVDEKLIAAGPEEDLYKAFLRVAEAAKTASYREQLDLLASIRPQVDLFFDKVLVNDPNEEIKGNRLGLLSELLKLSNIVDFSEIVTQGASA